jgi:Fe-S-cluster-containing hydrogenase component 2
VNIDPEACTGCALCEPACPYGTIHMQSLVSDGEMEVKASPISTFLGKLPLLSSLMKPKAVVKEEAKAADDGGKKRLRMAVKCDLCAGRGDRRIYNCPCGAIERIDPSVHWAD